MGRIRFRDRIRFRGYVKSVSQGDMSSRIEPTDVSMIWYIAVL
jgi:hypothetical protein